MRRMPTASVAIWVACGLGAAPSLGAETPERAAATPPATTSPAKPVAPTLSAEEWAEVERVTNLWLTHVDLGNYSSSWDIAALQFQTYMDEAEWQRILTEFRKPLGKNISRNLNKVETRLATLQMPKFKPPVRTAKFTRLTYESVFENGRKAEVLDLYLSIDGFWRVNGYFLRELPVGKGNAVAAPKKASVVPPPKPEAAPVGKITILKKQNTQ